MRNCQDLNPKAAFIDLQVVCQNTFLNTLKHYSQKIETEVNNGSKAGFAQQSSP